LAETKSGQGARAGVRAVTVSDALRGATSRALAEFEINKKPIVAAEKKNSLMFLG
jgi:hypothetical protein